MGLKKHFLFIIVIFFIDFLYAYTPNSFVVEPISVSDKSITITNETVSFSGVNINVNYSLKNYSNKTINLSINIDCYPTEGARWLFTPVLIPDDFTIFEKDKKISYSVMFEGKEYKDGETLSERGDGKSSIIFSLIFKPKEEKLITINYNNDSEILKNQFNTGHSLVTRHFFNSNSLIKKVFYIPDDKSLKENAGFSLRDFLIKKNSEYFICTDFFRIYNDEAFIWYMEVPNNINEAICRQEYFYPLGDFSSYALWYREAFIDIEEPILIKYNKKNLSKELLTEVDIFTLSKKQLSILRNSLYAKRGYNFKNKELRNYFEANCEAQGINYIVNTNFSESDFNETEKQNIEIIKKMENLKIPLFLSDLLK